MTDIRPRMTADGLVCSGEKCPAHEVQPDIYAMHICTADPTRPTIHDGKPCIPGLRRLLTESRAECDRLRHEVAHPADAEELRKLREERDAARRDAVRDFAACYNQDISARSADGFCRVRPLTEWAEAYLYAPPPGTDSGDAGTFEDAAAFAAANYEMDADPDGAASLTAPPEREGGEGGEG